MRMDAFVEKHPDAELHGFFTTKSSGLLEVVVLARVVEPSEPILAEAVGYQAETPEALIAAACAGGFEIGEVEYVREACLPKWKALRRRHR
jgi:hypothetical protein